MKQFTKEERGWIMYDWANSAFATIMLAAVFPIFFVGIAGGDDTPGSMWWARGLAVSRLALGIAAPLIGAIIAYKGYKIRLFVTFIAIGILAHFFLAFQSSWQLLLIAYIFANVFWSAANIVYDSYLPDVTTKDRMDKVSAWGFAMGYIGGSTIPFVISIFLILFGESLPVPIDNMMAVRISILMTALWWGIFSVPMLRDVKHKYGVDVPRKGMIAEALKKALDTAKKIFKDKALLIFILAYFFYIDGVGTVIGIATAYGAELGLGVVGMIGALFLTQIVAFPFSILFGRLASRFSSINIIIGAICVYLAICAMGFIMGFGMEDGRWFGAEVAIIIFWALAFTVGTVQGGIQATSRAVYARLIPPEHSGEYFGFFEIFGRFAAILGPFLYAVILGATRRPSFAILAIAALFLVGLVILIIGKKHLNLRPVSG
ncbi:MAG: MFS transporter [Treponema sp.]|nr:MFS transporter [Treponema sp.]